MILEDMQPVLGDAFAAYPGADYFGKPITVERLDAAVFFDMLALFFSPGFGAKISRAQGYFFQIDTFRILRLSVTKV